MAHLLQHLTDAYLWDIAEHFAGLDIPYAAAPASRAAVRSVERGEQLALRGDPTRALPACTQCHGVHLMGGGTYIPGLLGLPRDYINGQIGAWKTGQRRAHPPDCMARVAEQLSPEDIGAVSAWLASQAVPPSASWAVVAPSKSPLLTCGGADAGVDKGAR